mmetsp:Transcript_26442/g.55860  ORF Transcript_26442/g.55860 Transcript_26442/m.55860 type:complete len:216 (-) Transcript_26442:480-1127(-)
MVGLIDSSIELLGSLVGRDKVEAVGALVGLVLLPLMTSLLSMTELLPSPLFSSSDFLPPNTTPRAMATTTMRRIRSSRHFRRLLLGGFCSSIGGLSSSSSGCAVPLDPVGAGFAIASKSTLDVGVASMVATPGSIGESSNFFSDSDVFSAEGICSVTTESFITSFSARVTSNALSNASSSSIGNSSVVCPSSSAVSFSCAYSSDFFLRNPPNVPS